MPDGVKYPHTLSKRRKSRAKSGNRNRQKYELTNTHNETFSKNTHLKVLDVDVKDVRQGPKYASDALTTSAGLPFDFLI